MSYTSVAEYTWIQIMKALGTQCSYLTLLATDTCLNNSVLICKAFIDLDPVQQANT